LYGQTRDAVNTPLKHIASGYKLSPLGRWSLGASVSSLHLSVSSLNLSVSSLNLSVSSLGRWSLVRGCPACL